MLKKVKIETTENSETIFAGESVEKNVSGKARNKERPVRNEMNIEEVEIITKNGSKTIASPGRVDIKDFTVPSWIWVTLSVALLLLGFSLFYFLFLSPDKRLSEELSRQTSSKVQRDTDIAIDLWRKGEYELALNYINRLIDHLQDAIAIRGQSQVEKELKEAQQLKEIILKDWKNQKK